MHPVEDIETTARITSTITQLKARTLDALLALPWYMRVLFMGAAFVFTVSSFLLAAKQTERFLVEVPRSGGKLTEGIIGRPHFINPVIAKSDADRDMIQLIYAGLIKPTPEGGFVPELAERYEVSEDGKTYTFTLREDLVWHDGVALTSDDVLFTIERIRDAALAIKSPRRAGWEGVVVETPNAREVIFRIEQPYAPFLENATLPIIPKHIWKDVPSDEFDVSYHNVEPVGSGPYRVKEIVRDEEKGLPRHYDLVAFSRYALGAPYIKNLRIQFFGNEQDLLAAYQNKTIDQIHTLDPAEARMMQESGQTITATPLPRVFALFFNQSQRPIFADLNVRTALDLAIDKEAIVNEVLFGYGKVEDGPLPSIHTPSGTSTTLTATTSPTAQTHEEQLNAARALLEDSGWQMNAAGIYEKTDKAKKQVNLLEFAISMPDVPELRAAAEIIKRNWEELGVSVTIKVFDTSSFTNEVLIPRKYDMLFYGQVTGRLHDPYAYWHSSQRNAPGLNLALYINKNVDKLLEDARREPDDVERNALLEEFRTTLQKDRPAIFLYSPEFLYATAPTVRGMHIGLIATEAERFLNVEEWYIDSERVWQWFADRTER